MALKTASFRIKRLPRIRLSHSFILPFTGSDISRDGLTRIKLAGKFPEVQQVIVFIGS